MENNTNITFEGKSILMTGGTGSLGKHTTKYLLNSFPEIDRVIIYSRVEQKQFVMTLWKKGKQLPNWEAKIGLIEGFNRYK